MIDEGTLIAMHSRRTGQAFEHGYYPSEGHTAQWVKDMYEEEKRRKK